MIQYEQGINPEKLNVALNNKCIPAYYRGFGEYADKSQITDNCIYEIILILYGYRLIESYRLAKMPEEKALHIDTLQKIYEIGR